MSFQRLSTSALVETRDVNSLAAGLRRFSEGFRDSNGRMPTDEELREVVESCFQRQSQSNAMEQKVLDVRVPLFES